MDENNSEENKKKKRFEDELILRKSMLRGQSTKIAKDNIKLRNNLREMAKNFLRKNGENGS